MRALILRVVAVIVIILVWGAAPTRAQDSDGVPRFEDADCPMDVPESETVRCGYLIVPERHANLDGPTIRLAVAILPSLSSTPEPDPVVYLEGGPGGSALEGVETWATSPLRARRDFILFEQRGTAYSEPSLYCPEYDEMSSDTMDDLLTNEEWLALDMETARKCRDRLAAEGVDLAAYNSVESAADIADLRTALGYETINLYSISYGTYLAQFVMHYQPQGIRSVILDSTVPVAANSWEELPANSQRAFDALFEACASDLECGAAFPNLEANFFAMVERANAEPIYLRLRDPYTGRMVSSPFRGDDVIDMIFQAMYDYSMIPVIPLMMDEAAHGDYRMLATFTELYLKSWAESKFSIGMYYTFDCLDELPDNDYETALETAEAFPNMKQTDDVEAIFALCPIWVDTTEDAPLQDEPVVSDIPTLVLAGEFDPITPPDWGRQVAEELPNSTFIEFPGLSHGTTLNECAGQIAAAFVDNPDSSLPTGCQSAMGPPTFVTGLTPLRRSIPLLEAFLVDFNWVNAAVLGVLVLFAGLGLIVWPIVRIVHRLRRRPEAPSLWVQLAALLAWLISGWNILFVLLFAAVMFVALADIANLALIVFGLPQWAAPLMLMPWASVLALIPLVVLNIPIWREKFWGWFGRLFYLLLTGVAIGFVGWMLYWRLIIWPF